MIYISKALPDLFRPRIKTWLMNNGYNTGVTATDGRLDSMKINFYSGTIPADIDTTFTGSTITDIDANTMSTSAVTSGIPNTLLASLDVYGNIDLLNLVEDGQQYVTAQVPCELTYVADGTIGFYEFLFFGKENNNLVKSTVGANYADNFAAVFEINSKSAFYGTVGLLGSGAEIILDKLEVASSAVPVFYEFGVNPQITV